ncbi:MAG: hypothetical protein ACJ0QN_04140 [Parvicellaceae bacterium]|tara:strand:+ start:4126 stop:4605 length:480 start_codon:yes stop_codon:yes gene_type:complete
MAKEKKEPQVKVTPKKSNKNIIILIVLLLVCGAAAFLLYEKKPPEVKETVDVSAVSDSLVSQEIIVDSTMLIDSILTPDTINSENIVKAVPQKKKVIRKISKVQMDNNPKYWMVVKGSNKDTTFYTLKNKKTGTKLSNKYFSKEKAEEELNNFRNIISK